MQKSRQVHSTGREAPPGRRRRKRGIKLFVAYAMQVIIVLLALLLLTLVICGCLYIREHVSTPQSDTQDSSSANSADEVYHHDKTSPADSFDGTSPVEPTIPTVPADNIADGTVVVLDAGHGGVQAGCAFNGVLEKDITLPVTLLIAEKLENCGVSVVLTREEDTDVSLDKRCEIANAAGATLFVSIHCNSYTEDSTISGLEGYFHGSEEGKKLAESILSAADALSIKTRNVKDADYQVLRETTMPSALIEIGFMSNADECAALQTAEYQDTIAQAVTDGVMNMLNRS